MLDTEVVPRRARVEPRRRETADGAAMAAFLAAGIGAFAMGLIVILGEARIFAAPALYGPAGGLSGRTTIAVAAWLAAWALAHRRWRDRQVDARGVFTVSLVLIALGLAATFPPLWRIFQ